MSNTNKLIITFICGCLEPGKDGVGDYSRRLAGELTKQGHQINLLAINDRLTSSMQTENQRFGEMELACMRIPASLDNKTKMQIAKEWIEKYNPEWLSLQYVAFSYQPKGLPFELTSFLQNLGKDRKWHMMFHEVYLGMEREAPFKYYPWGFVQKSLINQMVKKLQPLVIHTQSDVHKKNLSKFIKQTIHHLPLFGNIAKSSNEIKPTKNSSTKKSMVFVLFGWVQYGAPVEDFAEETAHYANKYEVDITLKLMGKSDHEKYGWIHAFENKGLKVEDLGEQSSETISKILSKATLGIATTPYALVDKSGTAAAMLEHDLPVVCVAREWTPIRMPHWKVFSSVHEYQKGNLENYLKQNNTTMVKPNASLISETFVNSLATAASASTDSNKM